HLLHGGLRVKIIQQDFRDFAALQLNHDPHTVLVGLVAQPVGSNAFDQLVAHQVGDALNQARLVHLVRQFGDDDGLPFTLADILEVGPSAQVQAAATCLVGGDNLHGAVDES